MSRALQRLVEGSDGLLGPGERIRAAGRARTVPGTDSAARLPATTIWAVSELRLFVFDSTGRRRRRGVGAPIVVVDIAGTGAGAGVEPFDDRDALLTVQAGDHLSMVTMDPADARAIVAVIERAAVTDGDARESSELVADDHPPSAVQAESQPGGAARYQSDPTAGDAMIAAIRRALVSGDGEQARERFAALGSAAEREWVVAHLSGGELRGGIDAWCAANPDDPDAHLVRGANAVWDAFDHRDVVGDAAFWDALRAAERDLWWALEADFSDPVPFMPLIRSGVGLQIPLEELCIRHDQALGRDPTLLGIQLETLVALGPDGLGSVSSMLAFAASLASSAPEGSPHHVVGVLARLIEADHADARPRRSRSLSATASRDVDLAVAMSVGSPHWDPGPAEVEIMNILAAAHARGGDVDAAHDDLERVGRVRTRRPWALLSDGDALFAQISGR